MVVVVVVFYSDCHVGQAEVAEDALDSCLSLLNTKIMWIMQILYIDCHIEYYVILCELCRILYEEFYTEYYVISYELCRILYIERYVEYYVRL